MFRPSAPALQCLDVLSGAGELPRRFVLSYVCARLVPVAPAAGAVLAYLRLAHWWHAVWCDVCVVSSLDACIVPWLGVLVAAGAGGVRCKGRSLAGFTSMLLFLWFLQRDAVVGHA